MVIYSATPNASTEHWKTQAWFFLPIGWLVYWVVAMLDYEHVRRRAAGLYFSVVAMLVPLAICAAAKLTLGNFIKPVNGARRWIDIGFFKIQPSEFAKVSTLVMAAAVLASVKSWDWRECRRAAITSGKSPGRFGWVGTLPHLRIIAVAVLPIGLIFIQPDLKSCIVYLPMLAALLYVSRLSHRIFVVAGMVVLLLGSLVGWDLVQYSRRVESYIVANPEASNPGADVRGDYEKVSVFATLGLGYPLLKDYQRERIMSFARPDLVDPKGQGTSWNVKQAIIATGRGGLWGTGWNQGSQAKLGYIPELAAHNDFVFSVFAEEFGFVGSAALLAAYTFLVGSCLRTAARARDRFGAYLCVGAAAVLTVHVVVNIGMNIGLMPVSGLPLPFLSYGGSFVLSCFLLLGLVQSVHRYSQELPAGTGTGSDIQSNALQDRIKTAAGHAV